MDHLQATARPPGRHRATRGLLLLSNEPWSKLVIRGFYRVLSKGLQGFGSGVLAIALRARMPKKRLQLVGKAAYAALRTVWSRL